MNIRNLLFVAPLVMVGSASAQEECSTIAECAQKAVEASYQAKLALQIAVPRGAVMAFNLPECPVGWVPFQQARGRVIVGEGQGSGLSARGLGQTGGFETHKLTVAQMPEHNHGGSTGSDITSTALSNGPVPGKANVGGHGPGKHPIYQGTHSHTIAAQGGGEPHNIMQPFVVLKYCERR